MVPFLMGQMEESRAGRFEQKVWVLAELKKDYLQERA